MIVFGVYEICSCYGDQRSYGDLTENLQGLDTLSIVARFRSVSLLTLAGQRALPFHGSSELSSAPPLVRLR